MRQYQHERHDSPLKEECCNFERFKLGKTARRCWLQFFMAYHFDVRANNTRVTSAETSLLFGLPDVRSYMLLSQFSLGTAINYIRDFQAFQILKIVIVHDRNNQTLFPIYVDYVGQCIVQGLLDYIRRFVKTWGMVREEQQKLRVKVLR
ncbi:MAG: hypothetical protein EZS28_006394 [Streblomastix strix]|uniref:Uncharacterized protein n=1 Tax=Streblomastix strix TaxID=222440 RepID=A0A5J4WV73_9EUKA|nr:MAG: hypothetical protein EZS28_006388 [Streblomastix strix]KAA6398085.1 MAG: hypothetical protein EZS28_006394 [Streblomastix strix]